MNIYDEINLDIDPFKEFNLPEGSSDITIKEAYRILKKGSSPERLERLELSWSMIKDANIRARYKILKNHPLESLDSIKHYGNSPKRLETSEWIELITNGS